MFTCIYYIPNVHKYHNAEFKKCSIHGNNISRHLLHSCMLCSHALAFKTHAWSNIYVLKQNIYIHATCTIYKLALLHAWPIYSFEGHPSLKVLYREVFFSLVSTTATTAHGYYCCTFAPEGHYPLVQKALPNSPSEGGPLWGFHPPFLHTTGFISLNFSPYKHVM